MIDGGLVTEYLAEASYILAGKTRIHLTILAKLAVHQVIFRINTGNLETIRHQLNEYISCYIPLAGFQVSFNVSHDGIQYLSFMQPVTIKLCQLVLPL